MQPRFSSAHSDFQPQASDLCVFEVPLIRESPSLVHDPPHATVRHADADRSLGRSCQWSSIQVEKASQMAFAFTIGSFAPASCSALYVTQSAGRLAHSPLLLLCVVRGDRICLNPSHRLLRRLHILCSTYLELFAQRTSIAAHVLWRSKPLQVIRFRQQ